MPAIGSNLLATMPIDTSRSNAQTFNLAGPYSQELALQAQLSNWDKQATVRVIVQNAVIVESMTTRAVPTLQTTLDGRCRDADTPRAGSGHRDRARRSRAAHRSDGGAGKAHDDSAVRSSRRSSQQQDARQAPVQSILRAPVAARRRTARSARRLTSPKRSRWSKPSWDRGGR